MRRAAHLSRLLVSVSAIVLAVPLALAGLAPTVARAEPQASGTTISLSSGITVFGLPVSAQVAVPSSGVTPTGRVHVLVDGTSVASGRPAADGTVRVPLPATVAVGRHAVTAVYARTTDPRALVLSAEAPTRALTVTRTLPRVLTDGTDWSVGRSDPKVVHAQLTRVAGVEPTGTVVVWVNGMRKGTATLDAAGEAVVHLATSTRTALVAVTYSGDRTFLPWLASPHLLTVR
ncbi:Ig-like domain repeat protein [Cellulomonas sp. URHE0023]|uniref:Ig-like domain repeat protein n=1 Tax=Cellulomonas sp. URHE0023 TaxID=1380354 RepID=UPI000A4CCDC5|nr:Ig-like domain repeat protein [Cellulomonas sp. URHE0023]